MVILYAFKSLKTLKQSMEKDQLDMSSFSSEHISLMSVNHVQFRGNGSGREPLKHMRIGHSWDYWWRLGQLGKDPGFKEVGRTILNKVAYEWSSIGYHDHVWSSDGRVIQCKQGKGAYVANLATVHGDFSSPLVHGWGSYRLLNGQPVYEDRT